MYAYQKRKITKIFSVTTVVIIVSLLIIIPNFSTVSSSLSQVIPIAKSNLDSLTDQQSTIQGEQSPYGSKQTQYWIDQLRQQPQFMDCTDQQLIHYLNIGKQFDGMSYVHSPLGDWSNNSDAQRYISDMSNAKLTSQEEHWVLDKQSEYASLMLQVQNYHC